jgi:hypothetical protein
LNCKEVAKGELRVKVRASPRSLLVFLKTVEIELALKRRKFGVPKVPERNNIIVVMSKQEKES